MSKAIQRDYLDVEKGLRTRELFFESLSAKLPQLFIYDKDLETMILNISAFNAFLNGFMQHLVYKNQFEQAPKNFPHKASWIHIPKRTIKWDEVFWLLDAIDGAPQAFSHLALELLIEPFRINSINPALY